jgi:Flp pilus assembly protein TadD
MSSSVATVNLSDITSSATGKSTLERRLFLILSAIALVYAFLAGLRTVSDLDIGWQMATGRWVLQHHQVPRADFFSYTAHGEPWTYPIGAGLVFYAAYLAGGYTLISWIGAAACVVTVALLLRRGSAVGAAIAIIGIPLIAWRTTPRADMFTVVLFAAFLSLLWENYRTGHARLWLLPLLMLAWVNFHFGFAAGLGLIVAYLGTELLETVVSDIRRRAALQRLRRAAAWLVCTALITLVNPWGWGIYRALMRQERANAQQQYWITEWSGVPLNWAAITSSMSLRQTRGTIYLLLAVAVIAGVIALFRLQLGAALLLLGAIYPAVRYVRMGVIFACVVAIVGGPVLSEALADVGRRLRNPRIRSIVANAAVAAAVALALVRCVDLVSNRTYFQATELANFGAGLGWWFPEKAAEFIERQNLPGEIFTTYDAGGYMVWRLGPQRRDNIDGRDTLFGVARIQRHNKLLQNSPDGPLWQHEIDAYNINTILLPVGRFDGVLSVKLADFCSSKIWQPVYLDEVGAIFVRRTPENEGLIQRFPVDCATAALPAQQPPPDRTAGFNAWANAASVLVALERNSEALAAIANALSIFPDSAFLHWQRANVLFAMGRLDESEQEYLTAVRLDPSEATWSALAETYQKRGRMPAALAAMRRATQLSARPQQHLLNMGYVYLGNNQPDEALKAFNEAAHSAPKDIRSADKGTFDFMVAQGRAAAWEALGSLERAIPFQEEAARLAPNTAAPWRRLAKMYRLQGRLEDADRAGDYAARIAKNSGQ